VTEPEQIFFSYARIDDRRPPLDPHAMGFVQALHAQLEYQLDELGPHGLRLWRDQQEIPLAGQFEPRIKQAVAASSRLLVVLSRNWIESQHCRQEMDLFAHLWNGQMDKVRERVVIVRLHDLNRDDLPEPLRGQEGHSFFAFDDGEGPGREKILHGAGERRDQRYWERLDKLASYLWRLSNGQPPSSPAGPLIQRRQMNGPRSGLTVFVAKPAGDMRQSYDRVVHELAERGHIVVPAPDSEIPHGSAAVPFINAALDAADLSVHLLGEQPGRTRGDAMPIVQQQLLRAASRSERLDIQAEPPGRRFSRIIWAPRAVTEGSGTEMPGTYRPVKKRDSFGVLKKYDRHLAADTVVGAGLTDFVDDLVDRLDKLARSKAGSPGRNRIDSSSTIYINHRPEDANYAMALAKILRRPQLQPLWPPPDGADELNESHLVSLRDCTSAVIIWGAAMKTWAQAALQELANWRQLGRAEKFAFRALILGPPLSPDKTALVGASAPPDVDIVLDLTGWDFPPPEQLWPLAEAGRQASAQEGR
jgi:hypothetical protein